MAGLNSDIFTKKFSNTGDYATQDYVTNLITSYLPATGTVSSISAGTGLSISGGSSTITDSGTIVLDATIQNLKNTPNTAPSDGNVLVYRGTSWVYESSVRTGTSPVTFTDLNDTPSSIPGPGYLLQTTSSDIVFVNNTFLESNNVIPGVGMDRTVVGKTVTLQTDLNSINQSLSDDSSNSFVFVDSSGNQRRIRKDTISLKDFLNSGTSPYLRNSDINVIDGLTYDPSSVTIGVCITDFNTIDLGRTGSGGVSGILSIENGGTSSSTASGARSNLGLTYNLDILPCTGPSFNNTMLGDNLNLISSGISSIGLSGSPNQGTGYVDGPGGFFIINPDTGDSLGISAVVSGTGQIISVSKLPGFNYRGEIDTDIIGVCIQQTGLGGTGAFANIIADKSYLNFGLSQGQEGYGFRNDNGIIQIRHYKATNPNDNEWHPLGVCQNIGNLTDVTLSNVNQGDILIANGSSTFINKQISGAISITSEGVVSITTGGISPGQISANPTGTIITEDEYGFLSGLSENIQVQLNKKIQATSYTNGDMIYYDIGFSGGLSTNFTPLNIGENIGDVIMSTGLSPAYRNIYHGFGVCSTYSGLSGDTSLVFLNSNNEKAYNVLLSESLDYMVSSDGGLGVDNNAKIILDIGNLSRSEDLLSHEDLFAFGPSPSSSNGPSCVNLENIMKSIVGEGLCYNNNSNRIDSLVTSSTSPSALTTPGVSNKLYYFTNISGVCYLAVSNGVSFFGTPLTLIS